MNDTYYQDFLLIDILLEQGFKIEEITGILININKTVIPWNELIIRNKGCQIVQYNVNQNDWYSCREFESYYGEIPF